MNASARSYGWFPYVAGLGIAGNVALALSLLVVPVWTLSHFGLPVPDTLVWTRLSGLLVILLSALYLPAVFIPEKLGSFCWLLVAARLAAAGFFCMQGGTFLLFAGYDATLALILAVLLYRARTSSPPMH